MKKPFSLLVLWAMLLILAACGAAPAGSTSTPADTPAASLPAASSLPAVSPLPAEDAPETPDEESTRDDAPRILIAYFSATGNTEAIAGHIHTALDGKAELYEILPETPYTDADLDYNDPASRSSLEMDDPDARPAISGGVEEMVQYEIIFLGYPIWWGEAPRIINTFLEAYDFDGKTIVPFCTSASSGIGSSAMRLQDLAIGAQWLEGSRFSGSASAGDLADWVNGLALA